MKTLGIVLWIVVPTAVYFWRAGLIGDNPLREGQPPMRWVSAGNMPFLLLTAAKVYLFWLVAVYMLFKAFTHRDTSSPWTATATVDGRQVFRMRRTRGWLADLTQELSSGARSSAAAAAGGQAPQPPTAPSPTFSSATTDALQPASAFRPTAAAPELPASSLANTPIPPETARASEVASTDGLSSEAEVTKELAFSLAALCEEASRLYDECVEKADHSDRARVMSQSEPQHPISKKNFADMADRLEGELLRLLRELHDLSARGQGVWSDFVFLAGGPTSDFQTAVAWCMDHGVDGDTVSTITVKGLFLRCHFGVTQASFLQENQRLIDMLSEQ